MAVRPGRSCSRALGRGDLLTALPALRGLRRGLPGHRHLLATSGWLTDVVAMIEAVDGMVAVDELGPLPETVVETDVAVDLHGSGPERHRVVRESEPRRLVAFRHPEVPETAGARAVLSGVPAGRTGRIRVARVTGAVLPDCSSPVSAVSSEAPAPSATRWVSCGLLRVGDGGPGVRRRPVTDGPRRVQSRPGGSSSNSS